MTQKLNIYPLDNFFNSVLKTAFDIVFSGLIIVFCLSWMFPLFALIIKLQSRGPVIYKQLREGSAGGHNGLKDIQAELGIRLVDYKRLRDWADP